jgi:probable rRNA maturation factor
MFQIQFDEQIEKPDPEVLARLGPIVEHACSRFDLPRPVHVIITTDNHMQQLNATFRNKDEPTDVLSFDLAGGEVASPEEEDKPAQAEIYVSVDRARLQGEAQGIPFVDEASRLVAHGLLHLAGYDHDTPSALREMESETENILRCSAPADSTPHS